MGLLLRAGSVGLALTLAVSSLFAQATTSIRGQITDAQGAAVPDAKVTLTYTEQNAVRTTLTDREGVYQFQQIAPGDYTLKAEKSGFATSVQEGIRLQVNTPATLNLTMEVGGVSQTVMVEAEVAQVNTQDATVGNAFTQTQVRQLPLLTRNVVELLSLQPGVTAEGQVLGARNDQNNVTLDGADVNDNQSAGAFKSVLPIPLDSVQEFRVTVGGQGAGQGRSSGGQVSLVTKNGTNEFHGSLYEFHRNTVTSANTWFNNKAGVKREALIRNQFGGSLGGPLWKNKLFFFFNYEQRKDASAKSQSRRVPTESLKQGIVTYRLNNGTIGRLSPADIKAIDPQHLGVSPAVLSLLNTYPVGNDPTLGSDSGLNFTGFRFNAPFKLNYKAYVAKIDYKLDDQGKHNLSWRGTLAGNSEDLDTALAQFPGQAPASKQLDNSRGFTAQYTAVLRPTLINNLNASLTRQGIEQSGATGTGLRFSPIDDQVNYTRGQGRRVPVWNVTDDLTWIKGKHTVQTGINFRFIRNDRFSFANSFAVFGMSRGTMLGLGSDITQGITSYLRSTSNPTATLTQANPVIDAMGTALGMMTYRTLTYQFGRDGSAIPIGNALQRAFATNEYEFYVGDSWRVTPELNLNFGIRYSNFQPPYEQNGVQVNTTYPLDQFFADRNYLMAQGVPANAMPHARLTYDLAGPSNGKASWYGRDNNNWAPRFSFAYSPNTSGGGWLKKLFGDAGVLRGGAAMVYDRFGSDMIVNADSLGSVGLSTPSPFPNSYNMATSSRYNGSFPTITNAPTGSFPVTPTDVYAVAGTFFGIYPNIKTPYSFILNMNYGRALPGGMTMEVGYAGRMARKLLLQGDLYTPLNLKDPKSGQTWLQMATTTRNLYEGGLSPDTVAANPGAISNIAYIENMWPGLKDYYFNGSATSNYFYHLFAENGGSDMDALHLLDRVKSFNDGVHCMTITGCHSFFAPQGSAMPTWMNAGYSNYHAMTLSLRRPMRSGFGYDFNYTWSHGIDNGSAAESGAGQFGGVLQSVFFPQANRGSSDFDIRHNINANFVVDLPFGKGKKFLNQVNAPVNYLIGGWQVSTIMRYRTALPLNVGGSGIWNTNYWISSRATPKGSFTNTVGYNQRGNPSLFPNTNASDAFMDQYPGQVGARNIIRGDNLMNWDMAVAKFIPLPWGSAENPHRIQFRAEAFNAFNQVSFRSPSLSLSSAATFGEFTDTAIAPRVMQFALRYEF